MDPLKEKLLIDIKERIEDESKPSNIDLTKTPDVRLKQLQYQRSSIEHIFKQIQNDHLLQVDTLPDLWAASSKYFFTGHKNEGILKVYDMNTKKLLTQLEAEPN